MINNRAAKKLAFITSWENAKKAEMEAELRKIEVGSQAGHTWLAKRYISSLHCTQAQRQQTLACSKLLAYYIIAMQEQLEKKKAAYEEKLKNKLAMLHRTAEERRAQTEARRGEETILAEEMAAKYRAKGEGPTKLFGLLKA